MSRRRRLSPAAQQARAPLPPADLVDARHEPIHRNPPRPPSVAPGTMGQMTREIRMCAGKLVLGRLPQGSRVMAGETAPAAPHMVFVHVLDGRMKDESWDVPRDAVAWWETP